MPEYKAPRGANDILPADQPYWRFLRETATRIAESYGYGELQTPVIEHAGVFIRPAAEGTDLVDKEVYRFTDRGGDDLVLRPEGTASAVRAYLEHGMNNLPQPVRLFYFWDFFRYDRPQAGRYRMFHQFGVETIGDGEPAIDVEVLDLLTSYFDALGLAGYKMRLNSIGDHVCRPAYLEKLRAYYADKIDRMCADCKRRYDLNPLRLLDCKNEPCQPFKAGAPRISDNLCDPCREHFTTVCSLLDELSIGYELDPTLVRGLDYYTRTTFEFEPVADGTQQSAIGGGGRYDGLIEQLGGKPTPGIGFGTGIERLILNLKRLEIAPGEPARPDAFIAIAAPEAQAAAMLLGRDLRASGLTAVLGTSGRSLRAQLRHANNLNAHFAAILGAEELATGVVMLRDLATGEQAQVSMEEAASRLRS